MGLITQSESFLSLVNRQSRDRQLTIEDRLSDFLTDEEIDELFELSESEYLRALNKLEEEFIGSPSDDVDDSSEIGVASQCLTNVQVGDEVRIFLFDDLVALTPQFRSPDN